MAFGHVPEAHNGGVRHNWLVAGDRVSAEVIIPVRDMADQLSECLSPVLDQLGSGDCLTVVDDASRDGTGAAAEALGAKVIRIANSRGPYFARQVAAHRSTADMLLFVDARCRALPGLLASHKAMLADSVVALTCTGTRTQSGPSLAQRVAAKQQPFSLDGKVGVPGRMDFYPTANLGVRRKAFEQVDGFRDMRSGADADLCWRIQDSGLGVLRADPQILMEWAPRTKFKDLLEQWQRYGQSTAYLEWLYPGQSSSSSGRPVSLLARVMSGA